MFSWITGPRITNVIEELPEDAAYDTTYIEPPDTPAHQFAMKAFKQAIFGTPAPEDSGNRGKTLEKRSKIDAANAKSTELLAPKEGVAPPSPSKPGILLTPGTANKGRKTVSFGAHVVDNEGKRLNAGRNSVPNECPGKFPSPWMPGTELKEDADKDKKPRTKLTEALYDARTTTQQNPGQKPKARDDSDITIDLGAPCSESGKYWKAQYESYAEKSEKEMKKLVTKQQVAKNFAKKKDGQATELATRLAEERKRFKNRERELEEQNKDYQERLRRVMAENSSASMEIAALKNRIAALEMSLTVPSSETQESKMPFQIYEDSRDSNQLNVEAGKSRANINAEPPSVILGRSVQSTRSRTADKENSPHKPRHMRRQTLPDASPRIAARHPTSNSRTDSVEAGSLPNKSLLSSTEPLESSSRSLPLPRTSELPSKSPMTIRQPELSKENMLPKSPTKLPSSPLPQPSPDPWMQDLENSPLPQMDRMALPISSGPSYSRQAKSVQPTLHRVPKSISHVTKADTTKAVMNVSEQNMPQEDNFPKRATHHAESSSLMTMNKNSLPTDRKEQAKKRLMERKQRKLVL